MTTEAANYRRWAADARGRYEVWYLTWNHPDRGDGYWLRFITENPVDGPPRAELWFARFDPGRPERTFGIHKPFAASELVSQEAPFRVAIAGAELAHDRTHGTLAGDGHDVRWDLRWEPADHVLRQLPSVMYARGGLGETTVLSPNPRVALSGTIIVDGEQLELARAIAGQTHLWGKKHAYSWTWGRCADFTGAPGALLEILGVRLKRGAVTLPPLMLVNFELDGERHELNQFRHVVRNRGRWHTGHVAFVGWSPTVKIEGELACTPEQLVNAPYIDPDGTHVWCANTEIGDARVVVYRRSGLGWREERRLEGPRRAHFETGGRERDPSVTREHVRVA
jgi:hypothetical protein